MNPYEAISDKSPNTQYPPPPSTGTKGWRFLAMSFMLLVLSSTMAGMDRGPWSYKVAAFISAFVVLFLTNRKPYQTISIILCVCSVLLLYYNYQAEMRIKIRQHKMEEARQARAKLQKNDTEIK